jgi:hypothetical protein
MGVNATTGGTGGLVVGGAEGSGKSASSTGTDTTDRGMDASVGDSPAVMDPGTKNTAQDRPDSQDESTDRQAAAKPRGGRTAGKSGS